MAKVVHGRPSPPSPPRAMCEAGPGRPLSPPPRAGHTSEDCPDCHVLRTVALRLTRIAATRP